MNKIQALNMLNDVVEHFSKNPKELRSISNNGNCEYMPPKSKPKSIGCAIGMYLPDEVAKKYDSLQGTSISSVYFDEKTFKLLPKWMQKMDINFLQDLQNLHDSHSCWNDKGLSDYGKIQVKIIIEEYNL